MDVASELLACRRRISSSSKKILRSTSDQSWCRCLFMEDKIYILLQRLVTVVLPMGLWTGRTNVRLQIGARGCNDELTPSTFNCALYICTYIICFYGLLSANKSFQSNSMNKNQSCWGYYIYELESLYKLYTLRGENPVMLAVKRVEGMVEKYHGKRINAKVALL